jgi:hypothetical protein
MFKRLIILAALIALPSLSNAQATPTISEILSKVTFHEGLGFDIASKNAVSYTSADLIQWNSFSLSAGYGTSAAIVGSIDYDIGGLTKLGINVPVLNLIDLRVGFMVGLADISTASSSGSAERNKLCYGPEITIVSTKF